ncbi:MAG: DUF1285 domain-containing protein [Porticoccaceae bacterium]|nr:DUF1285 domain-containing protein [Porticoccaceae bacterium]
MNSLISPEQLFADLIEQANKSSSQLPPAHLWHPEKTGDMDMFIDREGRWLHQSVEIKRPAMVKLFASILRIEDGDYFLVAPNEKWQIQVDIAPLYIVDAKRTLRQDIQVISFTTSTEDQVLLGPDNRLIMHQKKPLESVFPLIHVRDGLNALVSRSIYYQLVDWGREKTLDNGNCELVLDSLGSQFSLGDITQSG